LQPKIIVWDCILAYREIKLKGALSSGWKISKDKKALAVDKAAGSALNAETPHNAHGAFLPGRMQG
jgi:hypothetical protein